MKELLKQYGISLEGNFIYEFSPLSLKWWDDQHPTSIGVQVNPSEQGNPSLQVIFSPAVEGIAERTMVFAAEFVEGKLFGDALVAPSVFEQTKCTFQLVFSEEQKAWVSSIPSEAQEILKQILAWLPEKQALHTFDMDAPGEEENREYTPGETLDHFFAMMRIQGLKPRKSNISKIVDMAAGLEGPDYIADLKREVDDEKALAFALQIGIANRWITRLRKILNKS